MLLELVSDLLSLSENDEEQLMPVVFSLSSWDPEHDSLANWLADELNNNYEVPKKLGEQWIAEQNFIPLLDGLDEVEPADRTACAQAINDFRDQFPALPMLVTSRSQEYLALAVRLQLDKAIVLQPLSIEQIDVYLASRGQRLVGLRAALYQDTTLRELAQSPLMLSIMTMAYYRLPAEIAISLSDRDAGRDLLFETYVQRMCRYRSGERAYRPEDAVHWLSWLADKLGQQKRNIFFVENMQPAWLPAAERALMVRQTKLLVVGLGAAAGLAGGIAGIPAYGLIGVLVGLILGLFGGALPILTGRLLLRTRIDWRTIETVEALDWSWSWTWLSLGLGAVVGLAIGGLISLVPGTAGVPWWLLAPVIAATALLLDFALLRTEIKLRTEPGQGILSSQRNGALVAIVAAALVLGTASLLLLLGSLLELPFSWPASLAWSTGIALYLAFQGSLAYGSLAAIQHRLLLRSLQRSGLIPRDYVQFLDYAAERNLLRKVGGGYTYIHALLLNYLMGRPHAVLRSSPMGQRSNPMGV
jgi:hypothetical protein